MRRYWNLKKEAADRTLWRIRFGREYVMNKYAFLTLRSTKKFHNFLDLYVLLSASLSCLTNFVYWKSRNSFSLVKTLCSYDTWSYNSSTDVMLRCADWRLATDVSKGLGQLDLPDEGTIIVPNVGHCLTVDWPNILDSLTFQFQTFIFPGNTRR